MAESIKQFNLQEYKFEVTLLPYGSEPVPISPDAIVQLVLEDQLLMWATKGFLTLQNFNEMFQRELKYQDLQNMEMTAKQKRDTPLGGYIFRNDGKDRINIKIKPIKHPYSEDPELEDVPDKGWLIDFKGNIYDFEEPMVNDFGSKLKKIYFWDEDRQKLLERNLFEEKGGVWSTATSLLNPNRKKAGFDPAQATDEERKMFTGDAIKDIFKNSMGFDVDEENFDKGKTKIFHTAPAGSTPIENFYYLWNNHLSETQLPSENYDISLLQYDDDNKKYNFLPLSKIFEKAGAEISSPGDYQIEHLILEDITSGSENSGQADKLWMAPILDQYDPEFQKDVIITKLKKYSFSEMSAVDSIRELVSRSVFVYDRKNKTFSKNAANSQIKDLPKYLQDDYINNKLYVKGNDNTQINLNKVKVENLKVKNTFTPIVDADVVGRLGHSDMLLKSILFNLSLTVELDGSTNRKSGRFIGIDRLQNNNNEFDYNIGGQWLVTRVNHNFFRNTYVNEVNLIKHQVFDKVDFNKDETAE